MRLLLPVSLAALLIAAGCSKDKDVEVPAKLVDFPNTLPVKKIIDDVTHGLHTPLDKARALTYWVRRHVRYVSRGPAGAGYTPHLPEQVLGNLYGDCKDQAQLLAVMLRNIGLDPYLVTLGTLDDGQVVRAVPSPWGTHAMVMVAIDGTKFSVW